MLSVQTASPRSWQQLNDRTANDSKKKNIWLRTTKHNGLGGHHLAHVDAAMVRRG